MIAYLHHAVGSLHELEFQLEVTTDLGYANTDQTAVLQAQLQITRSMILGLLVALRRRSSPPT